MASQIYKKKENLSVLQLLLRAYQAGIKVDDAPTFSEQIEL